MKSMNKAEFYTTNKSQGTCNEGASDKWYTKMDNKRPTENRRRLLYWCFQLVMPVTKSMSEAGIHLVLNQNLYPKNKPKKTGMGR